MNPKFKKIWNAVTLVVIVLVAALAVSLVGAKLLGFEIYTVLSGSMEPTYKTGSIVYVKDVDVNSLKEGDPITFYLAGDTVATHRIVEIKDDNGLSFTTKGDNNDIIDSAPVTADRVIGKPVFTIPYLGYVSNFLQTSPGRYVMIAVGLLVVLMVFLPDIIAPSKKQDEKDTENDGQQKTE